MIAADPTFMTGLDAFGEPPGRPLVLPLGTHVSGVYELRAVLGEGGMAQVFEAHDTLLHRTVAIKAARPEYVRWLRLEAQALAAIRHPCIPAVHAMGVHGGVEYIVMERILGASLAELIARRRVAQQPFAVDEALDLLIAVADGLAVIHAAGLSHRDVKPHNVMFAPGDRAVIMDFGLVLAECEPGTTPVAGTPEYMAPEIIQGRDARGEKHLADIYSFGVMAYELLAGEPPFRGATAADTLKAHLTQDAPDLLRVRPDVSPALADLLDELLAKDPQDRPQEMELVLWRLRGLRARPEGPERAAFSILAVDDDDDSLVMLRRTAMRAAPCTEVEVARSAPDALEAFDRRRPHVLLLDLELPGMNGLELVMALFGRGLDGRTTIVPVTGRARFGDRELLRSLGVVHFLQKGPDLAHELTSTLRTLRRLHIDVERGG